MDCNCSREHATHLPFYSTFYRFCQPLGDILGLPYQLLGLPQLKAIFRYKGFVAIVPGIVQD